MATIDVLDAGGNTVALEKPLAAGRGPAASSRPVAISTEDKTALDAAVTALQVIDDWDESDRAKVNPIVGQAGVAAGAGAVGATVQRMTLGSDDPAVASLGVIDDWDNNDAVKVSGPMAFPSANFTRPADTTAYASGDLVANSTTAGSVTPLSFANAVRYSGGSASVRRARLKKSTTGLTNAQFRLHLYTTQPTVTNGDNGVWLSPESGYVGSLDINVDKAFSDAAKGIGAPLIGSECSFAASVTTLYGLIEARGAYTPGNAEVFTAELEIWQS